MTSYHLHEFLEIYKFSYFYGSSRPFLLFSHKIHIMRRIVYGWRGSKWSKRENEKKRDRGRMTKKDERETERSQKDWWSERYAVLLIFFLFELNGSRTEGQERMTQEVVCRWDSSPSLFLGLPFVMIKLGTTCSFIMKRRSNQRLEQLSSWWSSSWWSTHEFKLGSRWRCVFTSRIIIKNLRSPFLPPVVIMEWRLIHC